MTAPRWGRTITALLAALLILGACGSDEPSATGGEDGCRIGADAASATEPEVEVPDAPVDELIVEDLIVGCGPEVEADTSTMATVHYIGRSQGTGKVFDSSWGRGDTASFEIGAGRLIAGWDEGLVGMKEGGRRELTIPGDLAYGPAGRPPDIGQDDTLVFIIDLIGATAMPTTTTLPPTTTTAPEITMSTAPDAPAECRDASTAETAEEPEVTLPADPTTALVITDLIVGCGEEVPPGGARVTVDYVGRSLSTGEIFDSSYDRESPANFAVGSGGLIAGWEHGMPGMKVGGRRMLTVPGSAAYGELGNPPDIGPDDTLVFIIDLIQAEI